MYSDGNTGANLDVTFNFSEFSETTEFIEILDNSSKTVFSGIFLSTERTFQFFHGESTGVSLKKIIEITLRITIKSEIKIRLLDFIFT